MPEGDTVRLAGRRLDAALRGRRLVRAELRHPRLSTLELAGLVVREVASVGKHLLIRFGDGRSLHTHFRLDGSWQLYSPGRRWRGPGHQVRAVLAVPDRVAVGFRLHDMAVLPTVDEHRLVGHLGPDLLAAGWGPDAEAEAVRRLSADPERELGLALLDQTVMAGVGNLYKAEVCFLLGVSPWTPVAEIDAVQAVRLCRDLLARNAERADRSTTGASRRDAQRWVFERGGRPCLRCGTAVRTAHQAPPDDPVRERIAYYCPTCQPGPHPSSAPRSGYRTW